MEDYEEDLKQEYQDLMTRIVRLGNVLADDKAMPDYPIELLRRQHEAMLEYAHVLEERAIYNNVTLQFELRKG